MYRQNGNKHGKIYQYDLDGNFIAEYESMSHCRDVAGSDYNTIKRTIRGFKPMHSKYIYTNIFFIKLPKDYLENKLHHNSKKIYQYDLDGNFIKEWENTTLAHEHYKINKTQLNLVSSNKYKNSKSAGGYQWSRQKVDKLKPYTNKRKRKIIQYDLDGNFIKEWESKSEAMRFYNNKGIRSCVENRCKVSAGFIWKYKD